MQLLVNGEEIYIFFRPEMWKELIEFEKTRLRETH